MVKLCKKATLNYMLPTTMHFKHKDTNTVTLKAGKNIYHDNINQKKIKSKPQILLTRIKNIISTHPKDSTVPHFCTQYKIFKMKQTPIKLQGEKHKSTILTRGVYMLFQKLIEKYQVYKRL